MRVPIPIVPLGDRAVRIPRPPRSSARALLDELRTWPSVVDVVVGREDVAVYFAGSPVVDPAAIARLTRLEARDEEARIVELQVVYDGPDLEEVARLSGLSVDDVIARHTAPLYEVETMGFAPGFAYLTGLDHALHLPRRATPRTRVPGGSVGLAGGYTGVYPFDSPGGWHLLGRVVDGPMFDARGARLRLGDRVRFLRCG
nr:MAG: allophanate hydrolase [Acidobacteriota bacterium]